MILRLLQRRSQRGVLEREPTGRLCPGRRRTMLHRAYNGTKWYTAEDLGPAIVGGPGAVARGPDRLEIFVRGADNQLWQKAWNGGWLSYYPLGGFVSSSPTVSSWAPNRLDVFVEGSALYHKSWNGIGWSPYERLGESLEVRPQPFHEDRT